jgi:hypothetical protein
MIEEFKYKGWKLVPALIALYAHDTGATDSGVSDPDLRAAVLRHLTGLDNDDLRCTLAYVGRHMLTIRRIIQGYGLEDVVRFAEWADEFVGPGRRTYKG